MCLFNHPAVNCAMKFCLFSSILCLKICPYAVLEGCEQPKVTSGVCCLPWAGCSAPIETTLNSFFWTAEHRELTSTSQFPGARTLQFRFCSCARYKFRAELRSMGHPFGCHRVWLQQAGSVSSFLIHQLPVVVTVDFSSSGRDHVTLRRGVSPDPWPAFLTLST
jgi:hypothetical protein